MIQAPPASRRLLLLVVTVFAVALAGWVVLDASGRQSPPIEPVSGAVTPRDTGLSLEREATLAIPAPDAPERSVDREEAIESPHAVATDGRTVAFGTIDPPFVPKGRASVAVSAFCQELGGRQQARRAEVSDDGKTWRIEGLTEGHWVFSVRTHRARPLLYARAEPVFIAEWTESGPHRIVMREFSVTGHVTDAEGVPIPRVRVESPVPVEVLGLQQHPDFDLVGASTRRSGEYRVSVAGPARFELVAGASEARDWVPQRTSVEISFAEPRVTVDFVLQRSVRMMGRLSRSDGGDPSEVIAVVRALDSDQEEEVEIDEQGRFAVPGLAPGPHALYARARLGDGRYLTARRRIELEREKETHVDVELTPSAEIVGQRDAGTIDIGDLVVGEK